MVSDSRWPRVAGSHGGIGRLGLRPFIATLLATALIVLALTESVAGKNIVETLPGFQGKLPFTLETGYVTVGDNDDIELFYYFIPSERNPVRDPLLLWLTGGPGCSGFSGLIYEIGPLIYDYESFNGSLPSLLLNPHSWTQIASIIFLDAPVGTGFSYSTTQSGYYSSDTKSAKDIYKFLRKWILSHPEFSLLPLYISGDSYSGMIVPQVTKLVVAGNKAGLRPSMSLQGYILGNPVTDLINDENARIPFMHRLSIISDDIYESAKNSCKGNYISPDPANSECVKDVELIAECSLKICDAQILEPKCSFARPKPLGTLHWGKKFFDEDMPPEYLELPNKREERWCRNANYVLSYKWANDDRVQEALHIRNNTIPNWVRCNKSLEYDSNVDSTVQDHYDLITDGYRALVYSGDHDMLIPHVATESWIYSLKMSLVDSWRPWFVDGQIAGYTSKFVVDQGDGLTHNTVKGAGHTAPEYKPKQCLEMMDRWLSYYPM